MLKKLVQIQKFKFKSSNSKVQIQKFKFKSSNSKVQIQKFSLKKNDFFREFYTLKITLITTCNTR